MIFSLKPYALAGILIVLSPYAFTKILQNADMTCPDSPNCVSSKLDADSSQYIEPLTFKDSPDEAMARLKAALLDEKRITIITNEPAVLRAELRSSVFRFVDDVEFILLAEQGVIHVRSMSRTGYYDFGVNRRRVERIRNLFRKIRE